MRGSEAGTGVDEHSSSRDFVARAPDVASGRELDRRREQPARLRTLLRRQDRVAPLGNGCAGDDRSGRAGPESPGAGAPNGPAVHGRGIVVGERAARHDGVVEDAPAGVEEWDSGHGTAQHGLADDPPGLVPVSRLVPVRAHLLILAVRRSGARIERTPPAAQPR
ncbi:hypothetical protein ACH61_02955 [Rathayibacter tanaceti]|uniref:Uncharacterized protein n=1 Tax=Rathayibacter tanaceti TaxID=1671680 RepID=A0A162F751_9MICO|nr:hypothetical protein ACH61_02955 [Rathayibacter tanaceti]